MSIIEKALGKLSEQPKEEAGAQPLAPERAPQESAQEPLVVRADAPPRVSSPSPAASTTSSRVVNLDFQRLGARGFLTNADERGKLAEEYRMIKRPLLANAFGPNPVLKGNLIMVTSSLPGEGKSFSAINLAISIAMELDRTVLLVDADVAKPSLPKYLGFQAEHGLLDVLREGDRDLSSVILRTNIEKLSILPAGRSHARGTELLASEAMDRLIADVANRYSDRLVLFDSPPILATSEANVLASHMGQIVMVVEAEKTPKSALREALSRIEGTCDVVSLILNKSATPTAGDYYGYYGYGGYGKQAQ
jgi:protein-tyrosine kinase